jgi:hypothetical protein
LVSHGPAWLLRRVRVVPDLAAVVADSPWFLRLSGSFGISTSGRKVIRVRLLGARVGAATKR